MSETKSDYWEKRGARLKAEREAKENLAKAVTNETNKAAELAKPLPPIKSN